jgi:hypothetical protein
MYAMRGADIVRTGGDEAVFNPMMTKIALLSNTFITVKFNGIVRARCYAGITSGTALIIHDHHTVGSLDNRLFGTGIDAGRIIAVSAHIDTENEIEPAADHPGPVFGDRNEFDPIRCSVFLLAGNFAGLAAPAGLVINFQDVGFHEPPP